MFYPVHKELRPRAIVPKVDVYCDILVEQNIPCYVSRIFWLCDSRCVSQTLGCVYKLCANRYISRRDTTTYRRTESRRAISVWREYSVPLSANILTVSKHLNNTLPRAGTYKLNKVHCTVKNGEATKRLYARRD